MTIVEERTKAGQHEEISDKIDSDTFKPTGKTLGAGCWGLVDEYEDPAGQRWAIKRFNPNETARRQMLERKLTEEDVMRKEAIPLSAAQHHVVPRIIERDKKGKLYVGMPVYDKTLEEKYIEGEAQALSVFSDVVDALFYTHSVENRAHGDIKPKNIFIDGQGRAFLSDFGSSTCISVASEDPRDNIGDANYRAPECYEKDSHPRTTSDVWSAGALFYELLTGKKIKEGCPNLHELGKSEAQKFLRSKIKKVPRKFRKILGKCLDVNSSGRYYDGKQLQEALEELIDNFGVRKQVMKHIKKWTLPLTLPATLFGLLLYGAASQEPRDLYIPKVQAQGQLYLSTKPDERPVQYDLEKISDLPKVPNSNYPDYIAKSVTKNRNVACLFRAYMQAVESLGLINADLYTDKQQETWGVYSSDSEKGIGGSRSGEHHLDVIARSIEVAFSKCLTPEGKVDLEDVLVMSRLGQDKLDLARRASGSFEFSQYIGAKDPQGGYIIPEKEQKFLRHWLAYSQRLFD